jgi:hypothetical protein
MINRTALLNGVPGLAVLTGTSCYIQPAAAAMPGLDDLIDTSGGLGGTPIANGDFGLTWTDCNVLN